jgi:hypothetical protein
LHIHPRNAAGVSDLDRASLRVSVQYIDCAILHPLARRRPGPRNDREYRYFIDMEEADLIHKVLKEKAFY